MTSYAKVKWDIIEKWNSDAKYTNSHLIDMASEMGVEIRNKNADRKSIVAKVSDTVIKSGVEKGEYAITDWGVTKIQIKKVDRRIFLIFFLFILSVFEKLKVWYAGNES